MHKEHFLQAGFDVYESPHSLIVTTPQVFASGDPACFWVNEQKDDIIFSDYGHSLNALELSLPNPDTALDVLKRTLDKLGTPMYLDGVAVVRHADKSKISVAMGDFINLFAMLTTYRPRSVAEQNMDTIMANIRHYLLNRFGQFDEKVCYTGLSGTQHKFAFQANNSIFEFAHPHPRTTGQLLRKIHDVQMIYDELTFNIFLDDLGDKKRFDRESRILSSVANIKPSSLLVA